MVEQASGYEWRGEGEEAEVTLYAPDGRLVRAGLARTLPATRLPGVEGPVYAAFSPEGFGRVAVSSSHAAPDLASVPVRGLLLVADVALPNLGVPPEDVQRLLSRNLSEVRLPGLTEARTRRLCEAGVLAAAEDGLIEEDDLPLLRRRAGDADALGRRAISVATREWDRPCDVRARGVGEVLDAGAAEELGINPETLLFIVCAGAGDLGRLVLSGHRQRIAARARDGHFGATEDLPAAPAGTEEAADLQAATGAAANFADGRAALLVYALRRAMGGVAGGLSLRAAWRVGGIEEHDGVFVHRENLAAAGRSEVLVSGGSVVAGTGKMSSSSPPFGEGETGRRRPWKEAGLLERWAELHPPEGKS